MLVILGLLVGGVLAGQSLIRAAELRSISSDFQRFHTAVHTFRDKYFSLPGDMTNAFAFWGTTGSCTDNNVMSVATGCNGNGNGQIDVYNESFRAWQHLSLAGLIEGNYSGTHTAEQGVIGTNIPASKFNGGGYTFFGHSPNTWVSWPASTPSNYIQLGRHFVGEPPLAGILTPSDAWNIDSKSDDGLPATGKIIGGPGFHLVPGCITGAGVSATYTISGTTANACGLAINLQ